MPAIRKQFGFKTLFNYVELYDDKHRLHSLTEPAIVNECEEIWFKHGRMHRDGDEPAYIAKKRGLRAWIVNNSLHRENDLPALEHITSDFNFKLWANDGILTRANNPALIVDGVLEVWYNDGSIENNNGPAIKMYKDDEIVFEFVTNSFSINPVDRRTSTIIKENDLTSKVIEFVENNGEDINDILNQDTIDFIIMCGLLQPAQR